MAKNNFMLRTLLLVGLPLCVMTANSAFAIPYCSTTESVNCARFGIGGKDCHQLEDVVRGTECIDVSPRGMDIIESTQGRRPSAYSDTCPSGFQPSENKCSPDERRRGCKDMRLPSGLGCVHR